MTTTTLDAILATVQHDRSGVGHCWEPAYLDQPGMADVREEIAAEITAGGREHCECYVAGNGQRYRW